MDGKTWKTNDNYLRLQILVLSVAVFVVAWMQLGAEVWLESHLEPAGDVLRYSVGFQLWGWSGLSRTRLSKNTSTPVFLSHKPEEQYGSRVRRYRHGAVAADSEVCSRIGTDILALKNGSAADAAIAAMLCVGVVNLHSTGIGGGSVSLIYDRKSREVTSINSFPVAPLLSTKDMFKDNPSKSLIGGLAVAVPGEIAGYWRLHQKHGRLPWKELFRPSIDLCENGVRVEGALHRAIKHTKSHLKDFHNLQTLLTNSLTDSKLIQGDCFYCPQLAKSFRRIANNGGDDFYTGELADDVISDLKEAGSIITKSDLSKYSVIEDTVLCARLCKLNDRYRIYTPPNPSGGPILNYLIEILKGLPFSLTTESSESLDSHSIHRIVEAIKFAFAKRSEMGDPQFVNVTQIVDEMRTLTSHVQSLINNDTTHESSYYNSHHYCNSDSGTSHVSVLDRDGNAVAMTSSINSWLGSYVLGNRTGILFNALMDDFATPGVLNHYNITPSPANYIAPGKRSVSSMSPLVVLDHNNNVKLVAGAAGGPKIISSLTLLVLRLFILGESLETSMNSARFHHQLSPNVLYVESFFSNILQSELEAKGHIVRRYLPRTSVIQAILKNDTYLYAVSDARKGGFADGY